MTGRMLNFIVITTVACCLIGCFSKAVPEWQRSGFNFLEKYKHSFLSGDDERASLYYDKSIAEIKKSGQLDILAKAYLTKCALDVAALEQFECSEFIRIRDLIRDYGIDNYFEFISGNLERVDERLLPRDYKALFKAFTKRSITAINDAVGDIQPPLSRIIAVGLSIKQGLYDESTIYAAINAASDQGWRKILLRYLEAMKSLHVLNGDTPRAEMVQRRINAIDTDQ